MTIEREEPGVWWAVCDSCGERILLDTDPEAPAEEAEDEVVALGWTPRPVEKVKFKGDFSGKGHTAIYAEHDCDDCQ